MVDLLTGLLLTADYTHREDEVEVHLKFITCASGSDKLVKGLEGPHRHGEERSRSQDLQAGIPGWVWDDDSV